MLWVVALFLAVFPLRLIGCTGPPKSSVASKRDSNRILSNSSSNATPATSTKKNSIVSGSKRQSKKSVKEQPNSSKTQGSKPTSISKNTESVSKKVKPAPSKEEGAETMSRKKKLDATAAALGVEKTQDSEEELEKEATSRDPTKEDTKSLIFDKNQPISEDHDHGI